MTTFILFLKINLNNILMIYFIKKYQNMCKLSINNSTK